MREVVFLKKSNLMKIIEEIEKSRLNEKEMNAITGGLSVTIAEECSKKVPYSSCSSRFKITECYAFVQCPDRYIYACTSPNTKDYHDCSKYFFQIEVS